MKTYTHKPMENTDWSNLKAFGLGLLGGMIKILQTNFIEITFFEGLLRASVTAFFCGMMGIAGKQCYAWAKTWYIKRKNKTPLK